MTGMITPFRICAVLLFCLDVLASAQQSTPASGIADNHASSLPLITNTPEGLVKLDVVVTDQSGNPVIGLRPADFTLLENGQPNKILSLRAFDNISAKPDPPVQVILLIDTLKVPFALAAHELGEAEKFLRQSGGRLAQPVAIFELSDTGAWWIAQSSRDGNALADAIAHHKVSGSFRSSVASPTMRGTPLEALKFQDPPLLASLKVLGDIATAERRVPGRKLLLWVGPGCCIGSGAYAPGENHDQKLFDTIFWFSTLLREARIALYSFSVGEIDPDSLAYMNYLGGAKSARQVSWMYLHKKVLAVQSGGRVLDSTGNLISQMNRCVEEANAFYSLSFDPFPADQPDEYHDLTVKADRPGLIARTNTGYYDQPYYSDLPNQSIKHVTVEELEELLQSANSQSDAELARQLSELELTERLSDAKLSTLRAPLRGKTSREALVALADASEFLKPPSVEIPSDAPPDLIAQQQMIASTAKYLKETIPKLPDYFARRTTVRFDETPQYEDWLIHIRYQPLHVAETSRATVAYSHGHEVVESGRAHHDDHSSDQRYLITYGTFGPLLGPVLDAIVRFPGDLTWSRWELDNIGRRLAIFRYVVPADRSTYYVGGCCLPDGDGKSTFQKPSGYQGEIAIDPDNGSLLRLELKQDVKWYPPIDRSDIMVTYGPVDIGGKTYICPVRSVSISRERSVITLTEWDESFKTYGPYATMLNDMNFDQYHIFRSSSRLLPGFNPEPHDK